MLLLFLELILNVANHFSFMIYLLS